MSYLKTWVAFFLVGLAYWGIRYGFAFDRAEVTLSAIYFSGFALFTHYVTNLRCDDQTPQEPR